MASPVEFDAEARAEFDEAFNWYSKRNQAAARGFASEVDLAIEKIVASPGRFPRTYAGCRQCRLHRYPYSVAYYQGTARIVIVAIAHAKRSPAYWRHRR